MPGKSFSGIVITETRGPRFDAAMQLLQQGKTICFDEVQIRLIEDGVLELTVESAWSLENITTANAHHDLTRAESVVAFLYTESQAFAELVRGRDRHVRLIHDYGMGAILVCEKIREKLKWAHGMMPS